jgi:hypothetical protein
MKGKHTKGIRADALDIVEYLIYDRLDSIKAVPKEVAAAVSKAIEDSRTFTAGTRYIQLHHSTDIRIFIEWEQLKRGHGLTMIETSKLISDRLSNELEPSTIMKYMHLYLKGHNPRTAKALKVRKALDAMLEVFKDDKQNTTDHI